MKKSLTNEELAALTQGSGSADDSSPQARIATFLERKLAKETLDEETREAQERAFREAHISAVRAVEAQKEAEQAACPHMKPNFRPATGGQKDHKGKFHFICQYCGKEFGDELPYHLRIPSEMVGGPI